MATYFLSIHDIRLALHHREDATDDWPLDADPDRCESDTNEERDTVDSWSLDADFDQLHSDNDDERDFRNANRQKVVGRSESCPGTRMERQRHWRIDTLGKREYHSREEGCHVQYLEKGEESRDTDGVGKAINMEMAVEAGQGAIPTIVVSQARASRER